MPLVAALIMIAQQLDLISEVSRSAVSEAAKSMSISQSLIEQTSAMERNARQYGVLDDPEMMRVYMDRRKILHETVDMLREVNINNKINQTAEKLVKNEQDAFRIMQMNPDRIATSSNLVSLLDISHRISRSIRESLDQQAMELGRRADKTLYLLRIKALVLMGTALLLAGMFTALITRPLRQVDRAIHQLGRGDLDNTIRIRGPNDLQELGVRLDWLRNRLRDLEQQRTRFMRHVSHELKTPLTAIQEGVALLSEGLVGSLSLRQNEIISILRTNCQRLQHLIESLLRFRMNNPGDMHSMPQPVRLDKVINRAIQDQSLVIRSGQLYLSRKLEKITVYGNEEQLRVVIDNLLSNAIKHSPSGGTIDIRLATDETHADFHICDQGRGIPVEERMRVFEAFYQVTPSDREQMQGVGLGLAIAAEFTQMNGGAIEILDSERGAHIQVRIPLKNELKNSAGE